MPWMEQTQMQEKEAFIAEWMAKEYVSFAELCDRYGVSRKTGYKWVGRFQEEGLKGLHERARGCPSHPMQTDEVTTKQLVALRHKHPAWGPKKLCAWLSARGYEVPAPSTVGAVLKREGLIKPRKRRQPRPGDYSSPLTAQDRPNAVWAVDFKGWFRLATGLKCYPLTVSDGYSRYLLGCQALEHPDEIACREAFERLFGQYGLPAVIRSDNGTPFSGRFGISTLSVWWIQHEALAQRTPAELYEASTTCYPRKAASPSYPKDWSVYRVRANGTIQMPLRTLMVSTSLVGEPVGIEHHADGSARLFYGPLLLGNFSQCGKFSRGGQSAKHPLEDAPNDELRVTPSLAESPAVAQSAS